MTTQRYEWYDYVSGSFVDLPFWWWKINPPPSMEEKHYVRNDGLVRIVMTGPKGRWFVQQAINCSECGQAKHWVAVTKRSASNSYFKSLKNAVAHADLYVPHKDPKTKINRDVHPDSYLMGWDAFFRGSPITATPHISDLPGDEVDEEHFRRGWKAAKYA